MWTAIMYEDYILHIIGGFLISFVFGIYWKPAAILGFAAGVIKEVIDFYDYGRFNEIDMYMTWAGATVGTYLAIRLYVSFQRRFRHGRQR